MIRPAVAGMGLIGCCAVMARVPNLATAPRLFLLLFFLAFACYAAGIWWLHASDGWRPMTVMLAVGILARLVLAPALPTLSTDAYRYVWDARVAHGGFNPYTYQPMAPGLDRLPGDERFPRLNHPTLPTAYPPPAH